MLEAIEVVFHNTRAAREAEAELDELDDAVLPAETATLAVGRTALNLGSLAAAFACIPLGFAAMWPFLPTDYYGVGVLLGIAVFLGGVVGVRQARGALRAMMMRKVASRARARALVGSVAGSSPAAISTGPHAT